MTPEERHAAAIRSEAVRSLGRMLQAVPDELLLAEDGVQEAWRDAFRRLRDAREREDAVGVVVAGTEFAIYVLAAYGRDHARLDTEERGN